MSSRANANEPEDQAQDVADGNAQDLGVGISNANTPDNGNNSSSSLGLDNPLTNEIPEITQSDGGTGVRIQINDPPGYAQAAPFTKSTNETGSAPSSDSRVTVVDQSRQRYAASNAGRPSDLTHNARRRPMVLFSVHLIILTQS
jgi:hypothetical protein